MAAIRSQPDLRFVEGDLDQPRAELRFLSKTMKPLKCFEDCLLNDVFGVGLVPDQRQGSEKYGAFVRSHKFIEALDLSGQHAIDQARFCEIRFSDVGSASVPGPGLILNRP